MATKRIKLEIEAFFDNWVSSNDPDDTLLCIEETCKYFDIKRSDSLYLCLSTKNPKHGQAYKCEQLGGNTDLLVETNRGAKAITTLFGLDGLIYEFRKKNNSIKSFYLWLEKEY